MMILFLLFVICYINISSALLLSSSSLSSLKYKKVICINNNVISSSLSSPSSLSSLSMSAAIPSLSSQLIPTTLSNIVKAPQLMSIIKSKWTTILLILTTILATTRTKIRSKLERAANSMEAGWKKRGFGGSFARTIEVWSFAITFLLQYLKTNKLKTGDPAIYSQAQTKIAILLRDKLLELGPTFIKLGQLLSTRIDVLPKEYIDALAILQDKVPGFSGDLAVQIIEEQLGKPIDQLYDTFSRTPLAAASLGQVHEATLNGKKLAVKIQRQGLKRLFDMDLKNIKVLAIILDKLDPKSDGAQRDWVSIYEESARLLYKEINYEAEAINSIRFRENFANVPWVKVPEVYLNMTTTSMITMEFVPSIKINDIARIEAAGIDREVLAKRSAESYLTQLCRHGFFHCDPHPGNVGCDAENGGRLIYYDFGMMDELKPEVKGGLVNLIFGIYENDTKEVCDALESIEVLRRGVDRQSVEKIVRFFLQEFQGGVKSGGKWVSQLSKEEQRDIRRQRRQQLGADLFSVGSDVPFKFPPTFTFVFRAFTSLDGIGKGLDAKYDITRLAQPFLKELVDLRDGSAFITFLKTYGKKLGWRPEDIAQTIQLPRNVFKVDNVVTRLEQGDLKLRVRVLESERSFARLELVQNNMALAIAASGFLNLGIVLSSLAATSPTRSITIAAKLALLASGLFGLQVPAGLIKLNALDKKFASFENK